MQFALHGLCPFVVFAQRFLSEYFDASAPVADATATESAAPAEDAPAGETPAV